MNKTRWIWLLLLLPVVVAWSVPAQAVEVTWTWTIPTTGNPVDHYVLRVDTGEGWAVLADEPTTPEYEMDIPSGETLFSVAGVDAWGRQGPWSDSGDFEDHGAPGGCGCPVWAAR